MSPTGHTRDRQELKRGSALLGAFDPDDWDFPPKPKGMRWQTYNNYERQYDRYDEILDSGLFELAAKFYGR